jgi:hypothetical protein
MGEEIQNLASTFGNQNAYGVWCWNGVQIFICGCEWMNCVNLKTDGCGAEGAKVRGGYTSPRIVDA